MRTDSNGTMAFLSDTLGSTVGLTNSSGSLVTNYAYQPFGATSLAGTANSNPYQFASRENDSNSMYFYRARYYSPLLQRFIAPDPIEFYGGDTNLYAYVGNNPITLADPLGLTPTPSPSPTPTSCPTTAPLPDFPPRPWWVLPPWVLRHIEPPPKTNTPGGGTPVRGAIAPLPKFDAGLVRNMMYRGALPQSLP
jgi:RHS repeat-associated protein